MSVWYGWLVKICSLNTNRWLLARIRPRALDIKSFVYAHKLESCCCPKRAVVLMRETKIDVYATVIYRDRCCTQNPPLNHSRFIFHIFSCSQLHHMMLWNAFVTAKSEEGQSEASFFPRYIYWYQRHPCSESLWLINRITSGLINRFWSELLYTPYDLPPRVLHFR